MERPYLETRKILYDKDKENPLSLLQREQHEIHTSRQRPFIKTKKTTENDSQDDKIKLQGEKLED